MGSYVILIDLGVEIVGEVSMFFDYFDIVYMFEVFI